MSPVATVAVVTQRIEILVITVLAGCEKVEILSPVVALKVPVDNPCNTIAGEVTTVPAVLITKLFVYAPVVEF